MTSRTYQATTMAEALAEVKKDLGRDAVILHTRSFRKGGLLGLGGRAMWEITASQNANVLKQSPGQYVPEDFQPADQAARQARKIEMKMPVDATSPDTLRLNEQVDEIHNLVEALVAMHPQGGNSSIPGELAVFRAGLLNQDISEEIVDELIRDVQLDLTGRQLRDKTALGERLRQVIASRLPTAATYPHHAAGPGYVIALVGPTGVGKTTTIAKLAADYKLRANKRVGLITLDTYRIAAVDQLKTYAEIIDVPLRTALTPGELHATIHDMNDMDVVLIDTAGRSQNDNNRLQQIRDFLHASQADEVHLVVSATANQKCSLRIVEQFVPLGVNRLILTKLDEAGTFGVIVNVAIAAGVPLSYVTAGQEVPDDFALANPEKLAGMIMGDTGHDS